MTTLTHLGIALLVFFAVCTLLCAYLLWEDESWHRKQLAPGRRGNSHGGTYPAPSSAPSWPELAPYDPLLEDTGRTRSRRHRRRRG